MKEIKKGIFEIKKQLEAGKKLILMLDFDGTISPIMPRPEQAFLPEKTRDSLKALSKLFPVVIISGRPIAFVQEKIGVNTFTYAGSHGLEWTINKKYQLRRIPNTVSEEILKVKKHFVEFASRYPKLIIENKPYAATIHYQNISNKQTKEFVTELEKLIAIINKKPFIRIFLDKKTVEFAPQLNWNKGHSARQFYTHFKNKIKQKLLPIYIGDSKSDEDAFLALKKDGITIRIGKNNKSSAKYYLKNQGQIDKFLAFLINTINELPNQNK